MAGRYASTGIERESLEFDSLADASTVSTTQSTSVIGALLKRFREGAPAAPNERVAPVKREEMWWIKPQKGSQVDDAIRESVNSDLSNNPFASFEGEASPKPRAKMEFAKTLKQRHDWSGIHPKMVHGAEAEPLSSAHRMYEPTYPSQSISQLSTSGLDSSILGGNSIDDLTGFADALLQRCEEFISEHPHSSHRVAHDAEHEQAPSNNAELAEQVARESAENSIRRAYEQHLRQTEPVRREEGSAVELFRVEELVMEDGSPINSNTRWERVRHNTLASDPGADENSDEPASQAAVTEAKRDMLPLKSPLSPARPSGKKVHAVESRSIDRESSLFPMYLSSSGDTTDASKHINKSAFSLLEADGENGATLSTSTSRILQIPEGDEENLDTVISIAEESPTGTPKGIMQCASPTLLEQYADGEVRVSISVEAIRESQSRQLQQARVQWSDVEPYMSDKVLAHLWEALSGVRDQIEVIKSMG